MERITALIRDAEGLLITSGAGMGVDSGLPDFRGDSGFWKAYPALQRSRLSFADMANPMSFQNDPRQAWGFYGHRLALYRDTVPHEGFAMLRAIGETMEHGAFVVTSNVDGQFQKAGFSSQGILEIHGSIHFLQCLEPCCGKTWSAKPLLPSIDEAQCHWLGELPSCPYCGRVARPNILMFDDGCWIADRQIRQRACWDEWRSQVQRLVVIECGAGLDIPSIRYFSEAQRSPLIRINPRDSQLSGCQGVSIPLGALEAIRRIAGKIL